MISSKAKQYFDRIILLNQTLRYFGDSEEAMSVTRLNETFMSSTDWETLVKGAI